MFTIWSVYMFALGQLLIAMCGAEVYRHIHYKDVETVVEDALLRQLQQIDGQPLPFRPHIDSFDVSADTPDGAEQVRESEWAAGTYYSAFTVQLGFSMMLPFALELIVEQTSPTNSCPHGVQRDQHEGLCDAGLDEGDGVAHIDQTL